MQYKVHYLCMVLYGISVFADESANNIGERFITQKAITNYRD